MEMFFPDFFNFGVMFRISWLSDLQRLVLYIKVGGLGTIANSIH